MSRVFLVLGVLGIGGCLELQNLNGPNFDFAMQVNPIRFVDVTLTLTQGSIILARDTQCVETPTLNTPTITRFLGRAVK